MAQKWTLYGFLLFTSKLDIHQPINALHISALYVKLIKNQTIEKCQELHLFCKLCLVMILKGYNMNLK